MTAPKPERPKQHVHDGIGCLVAVLSLPVGGALAYLYPWIGLPILAAGAVYWIRFAQIDRRDRAHRKTYQHAAEEWRRSVTPPEGNAWRLLFEAEHLREAIEDAESNTALAIAADFTSNESVRSHCGGTPAVPAGFRWPRDSEGKPLEFLAQIALEELPDVEHPLPRTGTLHIFATACECRVFHHPPDATLTIEPPPRPPSKRLARRPICFRSFQDFATRCRHEEQVDASVFEVQQYLQGQAFTLMGVDHYAASSTITVLARFHVPNVALPRWVSVPFTQLNIPAADLAQHDFGNVEHRRLGSK